MVKQLRYLGCLLWLAVSSPALGDISTDEVCARISNKLASVSMDECLAAKLTKTGHFSVEGSPLLIREYPPIGSRVPQGKVLLVGGTHGDELASISVVFKWMQTLNKHHSGLFHWRINPLMNPDGALKKHPTRTNARQVDLNRNFLVPDLSRGSALDYWKSRGYRNKRRYPGTQPLSEPETLWLHQEIREFQPDVIIAVHAPFSLVDFDAPNRNNAPKRIGYLHRNLMGTYPGLLGSYAGVHLGIPVITLELPHAGIMPSKDDIRYLWVDLVRWLIRNI